MQSFSLSRTAGVALMVGMLSSALPFFAEAAGAPVITVQPVSQTILIGKQFNVQVNVTSATPVKYTWYRNGVAIPNLNAYMWYVAAATPQDAGSYYVVVSNSDGSVTSASATITIPGASNQVVAPPIITQQPFASTRIETASTVTLGSGAEYLYLALQASGAGPLTYTWYKNGTAIATGSANSLWYNPVQVAQAGQYYVVVSNAGGSVKSNTVTVAASNTQAPTPPQVVATTMQLGACGSCDGIAGVQQFEHFMGRKADYVLVWGWADTVNNFMYSAQYLDEMWPRGTYYLHWSMPMIPDGTTFKQAIDGTYDYAYRAVAERIASRDPHAIIRIGHEMNGTWYAWSQDSAAGSAAEFAAAYRHIVEVYRSVSPDFQFVWNPGAGKWGGIDFATTYPGDAYVDYISFDQYEDKPWLSGTPAERWQHFLVNDGRGLDYLAQFAAAHGKKIAFDEWASNYDDGAYVSYMYQWMLDHGVAYHMYWNSEAAFSGSFATHPTNGAVFKQLFGN